MKTRIITYWLLLFVPTAVIAAVAFQLLRHEQERINQQALVAARKSALVIGDTLQGTVQAVEDELTVALAALAPEEIADALSRWESRNPLIRNAFILDPVHGLLKPLPDSAVTGEEALFINRYNALFSGRVPWQAVAMEGLGNSAPKGSPPATGLSSLKSKDAYATAPLQKSPERRLTARRTLLELAKGEPKESLSASGDTDAAPPGASGWIPWYADNNLFLLGWVQPQPEGFFYGVELEIMTLLSRLILDFPGPDAVPDGMVYGLIDGSGNMLHQAGEAMVNGLRPDIEVSLTPQLPHWKIAIFFAEGAALVQPAEGFFALSVLLLAIFVIAIVMGGILLTLQALRNLKDARQKTSFVSNVSHELKTPLTSIRMYAELLNEDRIKSTRKKKQYLQVITDESQRLTRLVNNVLDFSRLEQKRKQYQIENLDMTRFLADMLEVQKLRLDQSDMTLEKQIPETAVMVQTDRDAIEQVLLNLLDNAVKYAAEGNALTVSLDKYNEYCRIKVQDRGPGVPASHRSKIFDKFHRVDDSLTARQPGSGLGLSIARRLLHDLNGDLHYEPREGGGSSFVVLIPLVQAGQSG